MKELFKIISLLILFSIHSVAQTELAGWDFNGLSGYGNSTIQVDISFDRLDPNTNIDEVVSKVENATPKKKFHFTKTDLKNLNPKENFYVWMGHSSYFLQIDGKKILVDPVFSGSVSPLKFTNMKPVIALV